MPPAPPPNPLTVPRYIALLMSLLLLCPGRACTSCPPQLTLPSSFPGPPTNHRAPFTRFFRSFRFPPLSLLSLLPLAGAARWPATPSPHPPSRATLAAACPGQPFAGPHGRRRCNQPKVARLQCQCGLSSSLHPPENSGRGRSACSHACKGKHVWLCGLAQRPCAALIQLVPPSPAGGAGQRWHVPCQARPVAALAPWAAAWCVLCLTCASSTQHRSPLGQGTGR